MRHWIQLDGQQKVDDGEAPQRRSGLALPEKSVFTQWELEEAPPGVQSMDHQPCILGQPWTAAAAPSDVLTAPMAMGPPTFFAVAMGPAPPP